MNIYSSSFPMSILEIPGAGIANLQDKQPFCMTRVDGMHTSYEWFYFEIKNEDLHIVLILSIKDAFYSGNRTFIQSSQMSVPSSVYLTWHMGHKLIAYSYSVFQNKNADCLIDQIIRFLNGEDDFLDLWLPDFSSQKYIHLKFSVPLLKSQRGQDFAKSADSFHSLKSSKKRHFWQYITSAQDVQGFIQTVFLPNKTFDKLLSHKHFFHDVYLKKRLQKTPLQHVSFSYARTYFDHNFGFEPLYALKDKWYWWHAEDKDRWEVVYFFPKINKSFSHSKTDEQRNFNFISEGYINTHEKNELSLKRKLSFFFVSFPEIVFSKVFGILKFNKLIESAPFYTRVSLCNQKGIKAAQSQTGTLEVLIPGRIAHPLNAILMSARQFKIKEIVQGSSTLEIPLSFAQICKKTTQKNGKSFFFASHILSGNDTEKAYFIYTICRLIDDATDSVVSSADCAVSSGDCALSSRGSTAGSSGAFFSQKLLDTLWCSSSKLYSSEMKMQQGASERRVYKREAHTQATSNDAASSFPMSISEDFLNQLKYRLSSCLFLFIDTQSTIDFIKNARDKISELGLEKYLFEDLVCGQAMDENFSQPKDFNAFYNYCFKVAGVVGLMMTKIFKIKNHPDALKAAENMGIAMQITNILRDIKEDFEMGRVYLPENICRKHDIEFESRLFSDSSYKIDAKIKIVDEFLNHALFYYHRAIDGIPYINQLRYRFCVRLMCAIYASILKKISQDHLIVFSERVVVSKFQKVIIFLKVIFGFHPLSAAGVQGKNKFLRRTYIHEHEKI